MLNLELSLLAEREAQVQNIIMYFIIYFVMLFRFYSSINFSYENIKFEDLPDFCFLILLIVGCDHLNNLLLCKTIIFIKKLRRHFFAI